MKNSIDSFEEYNLKNKNILQNCNTIIHNTIFNFSHTSNATGGVIFAAN